ncbi:MAG: patatin-like phospholipase family protein [Proteobacteria bacterium]|nr:patatin-like phospholipase family protein [Pseudomonadota bacterium]
MKIGLSLSGGGVRATVFHLGVLARVAESSKWKDIRFISTVSGGSLCVALVYAKSERTWPDSSLFLQDVLPKLKSLLTTFDLEAYYKWSLINPYWWIAGRAKLVSKLIQKHWGINGNISQIPDFPNWEICATSYETGKNWRFSKKRMGDYISNYVVSPSFPLSDAVAASAAVPGLIGPLSVDITKYQWCKYDDDRKTTISSNGPTTQKIRLWDGGVYDNLGLESMFKPQKGLRVGLDFLIISDASRPIKMETKRFQFKLPPYIPPFRLIDVATDQVRAIRLRIFVNFLSANKNAGTIFHMGNTMPAILAQANATIPDKWNEKKFLSESQVSTVAGMETTLRKLDLEEYDLLFQHGYEVADATLYASWAYTI